MGISVTDPLTPAISRAKFITFQPFNLGKWFVLGFVAWLASLGQNGGGGNYNFNTPNFGRTTPPAPIPAPFPGSIPRGTSVGTVSSTGPDELWTWITSNLGIAIAIGLAIVVVIIVIVLVLLWISSRGKFMFLEAIANNTYEVVAPWKRYRPLGNSLFAFRAMLAVIGMAGTLVVAGVVLLLAWSDIQAKTFGGGALAAILVGAAILLPMGLALALISWAVDTFVSIIMYATGQTAMPAWKEFREDVLRGNVGSFILFLLMQILLGIGMVVAQMLVGCVTCCIGFLPYISTVITLPLAVFMRSYSIYFLQQFSPRYVIIVEEPPMPMTYGFPVMPMPGTEFPPPPPPIPPQV